ncbi:SAM-dependent methyltransferase, partial [Limnohabitans sp.]|uniref:SAM-dependent methyltransferase n=1 Tax=Limnohabitans sp. TaxID=1907725 RepID=UPI003918CF5A
MSCPCVPSCTLVGAGPGDPELLTLKAVKAIARATVLFVDDLVNPAVLEHALPSARIVQVGKRGGCQSTPQAFIHKLMVQAVHEGECVVRLKGGDPFIFGRGGEEVEHLRAEGIEVEVVNGITSGLAGLAVGVVALRLRSDYLAITTFGIAVTIQLVATNAQWLTGGTFGVQFIPKPLQGWLGTGTPWTLAYLGLVGALLLAVYAGLQTLTRSPWGRVLRAIREDEGAAASLGKRAFLFRLQSFVIGSMLMGLGGAVYAHFVGSIAPEDFLPILTFQIWAMLIVGGAGNHRGAVLGAFVVWG